MTEALKAGYTHIDTARMFVYCTPSESHEDPMSDSRYRYGTEPAVGAAIKKSGIPRSKIFITTKVRHPKPICLIRH